MAEYCPNCGNEVEKLEAHIGNGKVFNCYYYYCHKCKQKLTICDLDYGDKDCIDHWRRILERNPSMITTEPKWINVVKNGLI